ncbi:MAG: HlyC/CorC family transporter, partial [Acidimicrobiales bacterium]|nr:HlyC/CorC family transporter [Acidimicrobiales bacterium]
MNDVVIIVLAGVLVIVAMLLVMMEAALSNTSLVRLQQLNSDDETDGKAQRIAELLSHPESLVNPLRLVALATILAQVTLVALLANATTSGWWVVAIVLGNVVVVFVFAEAVPRTWGILHSDRLAMSLGRPVAALVGFPPLRWLTQALIVLTNIIVPGKGLRRGPFAVPEEFIALADAAVADEVIEQDDRDLIESVIEFGQTIVREVMVPRPDMTFFRRDEVVENALQLSSAAGYSRLPVVGENADDVLGLVYVKDLIRAELDGLVDAPVTNFLRDGHFVPESKKVAELLREMQQQTFHMAMVVDEYGGIAGLVTLEDLIEELVGEIVDEYDREEPLVERQPDGSLGVDARIPIDELNDLGNLQLPEGD